MPSCNNLQRWNSVAPLGVHWKNLLAYIMLQALQTLAGTAECWLADLTVVLVLVQRTRESVFHSGYNERRKLRTSCFWLSWSALKFFTTPFASDALKVKKLPLRCARIASSKSDVRPSCRKNSRCPRPHSGAVRNSLGRACPWLTPSASPGPMSWTNRSEKRFTGWSRSAATAALPV